MQLYTGPLGDTLQQEAFKFWAYSLCFSITSRLVALWQGHPVAAAPVKAMKKSRSAPKPIAVDKPSRTKIWKDLLVDCCDLLIPAVTVGWVSMEVSLLGAVILISTVGAGLDIWQECSGNQKGIAS
jgi:hypothetical protein